MDHTAGFSGLPFYCGDYISTTDCCFNHRVGLPKKHGKALPLFDYELNILDLLENQDKKYLWVLKATGLGITEFFLRYIVWICLCKNERFKNTKICLVTGPREKLTITLVNRIKSILLRLGIVTNTENTVAEINSVHIEAFPSNHLDAMRGLTDVSFIFLDEADFFEKTQQEEARAIAERYIAKSDPYIVMVSTPNLPGGLFEQMQYDDSKDFIYHRLTLPYTIGVGKIYTEEEIARAKLSPSFEREYNLKYGFGIGNVFLPEQIEACILDDDANTLFEEWKEQNIGYTVSIGIDPAFGSSKFAICAIMEIDSKLHVLHTEEFERADISYMTEVCFDLITKYDAAKVYIDAANPGLIKSLKIAINEHPDYDKVVAQARHDKVAPGERMRIVPVNFTTDGREILTHMQSLVSSNLILISREYNRLIEQMRIAEILPSTGKLNKYKGPTMDSLDACMMAASLWKFR